jgi:membrane-associated protease RseP (regulator of RpoE activity)
MTEEISQTDHFTPLVSQILNIEEITWGGAQLNFVVRYRGHLTKDSIEAYDQIAAALKPHRITPLFLEENEMHTVLLKQGVIEPTPSNPWTNLALFLLTLVSMLFVGGVYAYEGDATDFLQLVKEIFGNIQSGLPFAGSLLAILLAHEFGHYLAGRYHKTAVTLPYFIPFPLPYSFGTMGAFIQLKEPPKNKRILHDIGIAGPLAGLVVAIPVLLFGLSLSPITDLPRFIPADQGLLLEGNSILYLAAKYLIHGQMLPAPASYAGVSPFIYWVKYLFSGLPTPLGGQDVAMHSVAWAGWAGLLVTALNLIPVGQLDGGHILYVLFGKKATKSVSVVLVVLVLLGAFWTGWWLWAVLIFLLGRRHAEPLDQITELNPTRKALAILALVIFIFIFTPVPLRLIAGPFVGP